MNKAELLANLLSKSSIVSIEGERQVANGLPNVNTYDIAIRKALPDGRQHIVSQQILVTNEGTENEEAVFGANKQWADSAISFRDRVVSKIDDIEANVSSVRRIVFDKIDEDREVAEVTVYIQTGDDVTKKPYVIISDGQTLTHYPLV